MVKLKGVSPVIAVVILIGLSVAIGVILTNWVTQWVSSNVESSSSRCVTSTNYRIDEIEYNNNTQKLRVTITNLGSYKIYGFSLQLYTENEIEFYNSSDMRLSTSPNITESNPLTESRSVIITLNMTGNSDVGMNLIKLRVLNDACPVFYAESKNINKKT